MEMKWNGNGNGMEMRWNGRNDHSWPPYVCKLLDVLSNTAQNKNSHAVGIFVTVLLLKKQLGRYTYKMLLWLLGQMSLWLLAS